MGVPPICYITMSSCHGELTELVYILPNYASIRVEALQGRGSWVSRLVSSNSIMLHVFLVNTTRRGSTGQWVKEQHRAAALPGMHLIGT